MRSLTISSSEPAVSAVLCGSSAPSRTLFLLTLFVLAAEICAVAAIGHPWLHTGQLATGPIVFAAVLLLLAHRRGLLRDLARHSLHLGTLVLHLVIFAFVVRLQVTMNHAASATVAPGTLLLWAAVLATSFATLLFAAMKPRALFAVTKQLGVAWIYATICGLTVVLVRLGTMAAWDAPASRLGESMAGATFHGVRALLGVFYSTVVADPSTRILGTDRFIVRVAGNCSGIEGLALILLFACGWIFVERRHLRLGRASLLVLVALGLMWCLNLARIAALIAIGSTGHPQIALTGFHTEAGWIAFTCVAVGFLVVANRLAWVRISQDQAAENTALDPVAMTYLLPLLVVLATSLLTRALASGFERLYPLQLVVACAALWSFRKRYMQMRWSFGALDLAAGVILGAALIWFSHFIALPINAAFAFGLARLSRVERTLWLTSRLLMAAMIVPFLQELAFRGYLARRIVAEEVESVAYSQLSWTSIFLSASAYGALQGTMWPVGIVCGVAFAWLARRRNSLGAAFAANFAAATVMACWAIFHGDFARL